jgi:hypothetical protein
VREMSELLDRWIVEHKDPFPTFKATSRSGRAL